MVNAPRRIMVATDGSEGADRAVAIIDLVREGLIDLLVAGRRGRGQLTGLLLGSVSQKLTTLAPCPVMIVP